jgi:Mce-associated membrane protein
MTDRPLPPRPTPAPPPGADADEVDQPSAEVKLSKAARLEARAARLREAEERRAEKQRLEKERSGGPAGAEAGATRGRGLLITTVLLAVLSAGLVVVLVIGYFSWQHQRDLTNARAGALKAGKAFALDFGAYDYRTLDADFKKVTAGMTAGFAKDYTDTSGKLKPTLVQYKTRVTSSLQGAGVTSAGTTKATVVVFLDQTVNTSQSSVPRLDRNRLQIQLERHNGKWLVAKLLAK